MKSNQCVSLQKASFLIAFILFNLSSFSQQFNWANTLTAKQLNIATNESTGDVYISGTFEDSLVMRSSVSTTSVIATNSGFREAFVAKLDAFGGIDWFKTFGGTPSAISVNEMILDHSGAILLSGRFSDSTDFAPGLPVHTRTAFSSSDGYVLKLDSAGNFVWVTQVEAYATATNFKGLVVDDSNNVYFSANFVNSYGIVMQSNNSFDMITSKYSVIKLDQNGDLANHHETPFQTLKLYIDASNNLIILAYLVTYDSYNGEAYRNIYLYKFNSNLNQIWRILYISDYGDLVELENEFKLVIDMQTNDIYTCDGGVTKRNLNGTKIWDRPIERINNSNVMVKDISLDSNGNVLVFGDYIGLINFKGNQNNFYLSAEDYIKSFLAVYNSQGDVLWANKIGKYLISSFFYLDSYLINKVKSLQNKMITIGAFDKQMDLNPRHGSFIDSTNASPKFYIQSFDFCNNPITHDTIDTCTIKASPTNTGLWKQNGIYHEVFPNSNGCDSVVAYQANIQLDSNKHTIRSCHNFHIPDTNLILNGTTKYLLYKSQPSGCDSVIEYNFFKYDSLINVNEKGCGSYTSHDGTKIWTESGVYFDTIPRVDLCDLVERINLNVIKADTSLIVEKTRITARQGLATYQWLDCDNNMSLLPNEKNNFYLITKSANVAVRITYQGCVFYSSCVQVTDPYFNSVEKYSANTENFTLYPNPTHNAITLSLGEHKEKITIRLRNTLGQVVHESTASGMSKNIDFNLAQGVYLLEIEEEENVLHVQKLIVH